MKTKTGGDMLERRRAIFSDCEKFRYLLEIIWDESKPLCQFIGLNPSTADEWKDDPTLRRCKKFARSWNCGGLLMTNLFAYRATDPKRMKEATGPRGNTTNIEHIFAAARRSYIIIAAWGNHGSYLNGGPVLLERLSRAGFVVECLRITGQGHPEHPLYIPGSQRPQIFTWRGNGKTDTVRIEQSKIPDRPNGRAGKSAKPKTLSYKQDMAKSKKAGKAHSQTTVSNELTAMDYWRNQAKLLAPHITDPWEVSELATVLHGAAKHIAGNYQGFSKTIKRAEGNASSIGIRAVVDRTNQPPSVEVRVVYRESFGSSEKVQVPDPDQMELPLEAKEGEDDPKDPEADRLLGGDGGN